MSYRTGHEPTWEAEASQHPDQKRSVWRAMLRGFRCRCPRCGKGSLFTRYLKVSPQCSECGQQLHHHRADDAPPYFTMFIVGHLLVPLVFYTERTWEPAMWIHAALWLPATFGLTLWLLPRVKGAIVGLQWAIGMHGFGLDDEDAVAAGNFYIKNEDKSL